MKNIKFITRLPLLIATFLFSIATFYDFYNQAIIWGILHLFSAVANIIGINFFLKYPELSTVFLGILNALIAFATAWVFMEEVNEYILFAWVLMGIVYLFVSFRFLSIAQKKYL